MWVRAAAILLVGSALIGAGCKGKAGDHGEDTDPTPVPTATPSNLIDRVLAPRFEAEAIVPVEAGTEELCRRLSADLLGRYVTADQAISECEGRTVDEIAADFQAREAYLLGSERAWRDRFATSDIFVGWRDLKELYALVNAMHRDEIAYDTFAIEAMSHPGLMNLFPLPEQRAERVFSAFMGRSPTTSERIGLAALYRPWGKRSRTDPDIALLSSVYATIDPALCSPASTCATDLYGADTELDFTSFALLPPGPARWYQLDAAQKDALREPGRLLVQQPFFWEAAADDILNRLLGWSDGGSLPNEPGILLPDVREVLTDYLRETRSIAQGERLVMGSLLYRMTSRVPDDGFGDDPAAPVKPFWASGPRNPVIAEVWLHSARALAQDEGDCDPRYSDHFQYGPISGTGAENEAARLELWTLQENRTAWDPIAKAPDLRFRDAARTIGGCPGFMPPMLTALPRRPQTGLAHAFAQESLAEQLCSRPAEGSSPAEISVAAVLEHQMRLVFGRSPTSEEIADYEAAFASCAGDECAPDGIVNAVCVALLGSAEMVFH